VPNMVPKSMKRPNMHKRIAHRGLTKVNKWQNKIIS
jgi:hypothetical protein